MLTIEPFPLVDLFCDDESTWGEDAQPRLSPDECRIFYDRCTIPDPPPVDPRHTHLPLQTQKKDCFHVTSLREFYAKFGDKGCPPEDTLLFMNRFMYAITDSNTREATYLIRIWNDVTKEAEMKMFYPKKIAANFAGFYVAKQELPDANRKGSQKPINFFNFWKNHPHRNQIAQSVFDPNRPPGIDGTVINTWRGLPFHGAFEKLVHEPNWETTKKNAMRQFRIIKSHLFKISCRRNKDIYDYVWRWLSHLRQRPGVVMSVALLFMGAGGAGKTIFFEYFAKIFGRHGEYLANSEDLFEKFNAYLFTDRVFMAADEVDFRNKKKMNRMKNILTAAKRRAEVKYGELEQLTNHINYAFTANPNWIINMDLGGKRRFLTVKVKDNKVGKAHYFDKLKGAFIENDNLGLKILDYKLRTTNLSGWKCNMAPVTEEHIAQIIHSLTPLEDWWVSCLKRGYHSNAEPFAVDKLNQIKEKCAEHRQNHPKKIRSKKQQKKFEDQQPTLEDFLSRHKFVVENRRIDPDHPQWIKWPVEVIELYNSYTAWHGRNRGEVNRLSDFVVSLKDVLPPCPSLKVGEPRCILPNLDECRRQAGKLFGITIWNGVDLNPEIKIISMTAEAPDEKLAKKRAKKRRLEDPDVQIDDEEILGGKHARVEE